MNRRWHAFFLSLTLLPGAGHYYLGQKKLGCLLMIISTLVLIGILALYCLEFVAAIKNAGTDSIVNEVLHAMRIAWDNKTNFYIWGLITTVILWIGSAVHVLKMKA